MLVCDICGKEINLSKAVSGFSSKQNIYYAYDCKAWQSKEVDMCYQCQAELKDALKKSEAEWYNSKIQKMEAKQ